MTDQNKETLKKFGKILLFVIMIMCMIITGASVGNYAYITKEIFPVFPMIVTIGTYCYGLYRFGKDTLKLY